MFPNTFQNNFYNIDFNQNAPMPNINQINQVQAMMNNIQIQNQMNPVQNIINPLAENVYNPNDEFNIYKKNSQFGDIDNHLNILADEKKKIKLTNSTNEKMVTINIPIYFTKKDLYSYVNIDDIEERQQAVLFYNNNILNNDESSIDDIYDNSTIILFQKPTHKTYINSSLYKYILKSFPSNTMVNIKIKFLSTNKTSTVVLPENVPMQLTIGFIKNLFDLKKNEIRLLYNRSEINMDYIAQKKIIDFFQTNNPELEIVNYNEIMGVSEFVGRKIKVIIFYKNKNIFESRFVKKYDTIGSLYDIFLHDSTKEKIFYKGKELKRNDKHSLASLGIKRDFECYIE